MTCVAVISFQILMRSVGDFSESVKSDDTSPRLAICDGLETSITSSYLVNAEREEITKRTKARLNCLKVSSNQVFSSRALAIGRFLGRSNHYNGDLAKVSILSQIH